MKTWRNGGIVPCIPNLCATALNLPTIRFFQIHFPSAKGAATRGWTQIDRLLKKRNASLFGGWAPRATSKPHVHNTIRRRILCQDTRYPGWSFCWLFSSTSRRMAGWHIKTATNASFLIPPTSEVCRSFILFNYKYTYIIPVVNLRNKWSNWSGEEQAYTWSDLPRMYKSWSSKRRSLWTTIMVRNY
jgi:hypothetical protein